jgi:hypothetical protein
MRMRNNLSPPPLLLLLLLLLLSAEQRWGVKYDIADAPPRLLRCYRRGHLIYPLRRGKAGSSGPAFIFPRVTYKNLHSHPRPTFLTNHPTIQPSIQFTTHHSLLSSTHIPTCITNHSLPLPNSHETTAAAMRSMQRRE